jgi:hypothetical protein
MIDMLSAERRERQMPLDYTDPTEGYTEEQRTGWNREREQYMFCEFNRHIGPEESALIICGSEHIEELTKLFGNAGHDVTNEDVTEADWFDPPL